MTPYAGRVMIEGPPVVLNTRATQNFALALHELATNAAKYGALADHAGRVLVIAVHLGSERQQQVSVLLGGVRRTRRIRAAAKGLWNNGA